MSNRVLRRLIPVALRPLAARWRDRLTYRDAPRVTSRVLSDTSTLDCCIAYNAFGGYCVPLSSRHRPAAQRIFAGAVYEPDTIALLTRSCGDGDIIHAGTFFGDFFPALSRACAPSARVWAFEPNPESFRCASITLRINDLRNVELTQAGLGERRTTAALRTADEHGRALGGASHIVSDGADGSESVNIVAIDEAVPGDRRISILQLDVEGYERSALAGALETIRRWRPLLVLETLPDGAWLAENVLCLGYEQTGVVHGNSVLTPR